MLCSLITLIYLSSRHNTFPAQQCYKKEVSILSCDRNFFSDGVFICFTCRRLAICCYFIVVSVLWSLLELINCIQWLIVYRYFWVPPVLVHCSRGGVYIDHIQPLLKVNTNTQARPHRIYKYKYAFHNSEYVAMLENNLTYITNSMEQSASWEANISSARQEIPYKLGTRRFISAFTTVSHMSLSRARSNQFMSLFHFLKNPFNIILPSMPWSYMWSSFLRSPHQNPIWNTSLPIRAISPSHLIFLDLITKVIYREKYRAKSFSLCSLHFPVTSFRLGPNILLSNLCSNILGICFSLSVSDQVSNPYKTTGKINLYIFGQQTGRQKTLRRMTASAFFVPHHVLYIR
jgi:hypothetical protein